MKGERDAHTLQTTALVHEAYLKLGDRPREFADRAHFLAVASRVMRQVLVDYARARTTMKRGGDVQPLTLTTGLKAEQNGLDQVELLRLDAALTALANENGSLAQLIELRYFDDGRGNRCGGRGYRPTWSGTICLWPKPGCAGK